MHSALIEASIALAREGGPDRVILREAARAAGVSHSAAYRHFADREALLAEVSRFARSELAAQMRRRVNRTNDPRKPVARGRHRLYRLRTLPSPDCFAPRSPHIPQHPATLSTIKRPRARTQHTPPPAPNPTRSSVKYSTKPKPPVYWMPRRRPGAEIAAWSAVHGLAGLLLDGPLPTSPAAIKFSRAQVLDLIERGLLNDT